MNEDMTPNELEDIRDGLGLTVSEIAQRIGVHERTYYKWTSGDRGIPLPIARLIRIIGEGPRRRTGSR